MAAATEYTKVAQELYISYFGRPADPAGLAAMTAALAAANAPTSTAGLESAYKAGNVAVKDLIDSFGTSAESQALYAGASTSQFVTAIFQNLFNRAPLEAGLTFWKQQIDSGAITKAGAAHAILTGATDIVGGADAAIIARKVAVAEGFTTAVDTDNEVTAYKGAAAAAEARKLLTNVNATTDVAVYQSTVNTTIANLVLGTVPGSSLDLTINKDALVGTALNDSFIATFTNNDNTLQAGDRINGGGGNDTLRADLGDSNNFAMLVETASVETVVLRAQAISRDSTDNNTERTSKTQIDAQDMVGVLRWEDRDSRADLQIEDVRILPSQITRDITIAMVGTDPGNVDFGLYFDQHSLRAAPVAQSGSTMRLQLMDTRAADANLDPLKSNPYNGFTFKLDGKAVIVRSQEIDQAQTYDQLFAAVKAAVANTPGLQGFEVTKGINFTAVDTQSGRPQTGVEINIKNPGAGVIAIDSESGWLAEAAVPANSGLHTAILTDTPATQAFKVTSTIILDDVGRGSNGGDLVIGGLSVGDTSNSKGVERFEITVERNSKLQTINSTNNALEEVVLVNGVTKGNLSVIGNQNLINSALNPNALFPLTPLVDAVLGTIGGLPTGGTPVGTRSDFPMPGTVSQRGGSQHGDIYGFHDVRLIDGSTLSGDLSFTAVVTDRSIAKYVNKVDTQTDAAVDNIAFTYTGGTGSDTMIVDLDAAVAGSRARIESGLEDFTFGLNGGAGNDALTLRVAPAVAGGGVTATTNWANNQDLNNNISISGGDGNDTIRKLGDGDTRIAGGAGDDTIYSENTGRQPVNVLVYGSTTPVATSTNAAWVFNTVDQVALTLDADRFVSDTRSDFNNTYFLYNTKVNVTYKGIVSTITLANSTTYKATDLDINQAIKKAINLDPVLSKLLVATDAESNALHVTALTDGLHAVTDLSIALVAPTTGLSTADITAAAKAYGIVADANGANVYAAMQNSINALGIKGDYNSAFATALDPVLPATFVAMTGAESASISDNIITGGTGNDVIVLGNKEVVAVAPATPTSTEFAVSNNETVVYAPAFGNDTIVNFDVTGAGIDHLDFTALGGTTLTNTLTTDKSITIGTAINVALTETAITALYAANNIAAQTHVYVAVDSVTSIGTVYQIADAIGANTATITKAGTIDLAQTITAGTSLWNSLTQANFVNSEAANYYLLEGAAGGVPAAIVPPTAVAYTMTGATGYNAGNNNDVTITVANNGSYSSTVSNYATGDKFIFAAGTTVTVTDGTANDNEVTLTAVNGGNTQTIVVQTPIADLITSPVNDVAAFNTFFGAGSLVVSGAATTPINSAVASIDAGAGNVTFSVATGTYTTNVTNYADFDVFQFVTGSVLSIVNTNLADGIIDVVATNGGTTTTLHLTGLVNADDTAVGTSVANFNTTYGAGSLVVM
ncbi:hypothetical protein CR152_13275 [Massilia violaceinigra]|uniref:DUF4214 domain-containing protein n=1 Tax=Massilia violaceinigra TaxID=2045208 RepID=A0A2D2DK75_9BURK|nr:DUF4214 domain-containing protein [Massilia violaceinigra]ATQ75380.1 hypothetical protein CR152_13275 [Massilia violaceinigra]